MQKEGNVVHAEVLFCDLERSADEVLRLQAAQRAFDRLSKHSQRQFLAGRMNDLEGKGHRWVVTLRNPPPKKTDWKRVRKGVHDTVVLGLMIVFLSFAVYRIVTEPRPQGEMPEDSMGF